MSDNRITSVKFEIGIETRDKDQNIVPPTTDISRNIKFVDKNGFDVTRLSNGIIDVKKGNARR